MTQLIKYINRDVTQLEFGQDSRVSKKPEIFKSIQDKLGDY